ncbi:MAG: YecA family protein [Rhodopirellula sp. JB055]|uniref:YecA family protein n=1 Tax=Rhodopirellula sp. JB055 TaxID=3342846 RepID=UPI00370B2AC0
MINSSTDIDTAQLVESLGQFRRGVLPAGVMRELISRGSEVMPALVSRLNRATDSNRKGLGACPSDVFLCYHLLGIDPQPILRDWFDQFLRCEEDTIECCSGEITQRFTRAIVTAIADPNNISTYCQWLDSLVQDEQVSDYIKLQLVEALFNFVSEKTLDDAVAVQWVLTWIQQRQHLKQDLFSSMVMASMIDIGGLEFKELAVACMERDQLCDNYVRAGDFVSMSDERQLNFLRERAEGDREMLADPISFLSSWHAFAWTTDDLDPIRARCQALPKHSFFRPRHVETPRIEEWLSAIDQSNYETYPQEAVEQLNLNIDQAVEPLFEQVRNGIKSARNGETLDSNGPYLAALLLASNCDTRRVLFDGADPFLELLDLPCERRTEWFGDSIDTHLIKALPHLLAGQTQPMLDRIQDSDRNDIDRASCVLYFVLSVYHGYLSREKCIQILRQLWETLSQEAEKTGTLMPKAAIFDAACLLSLPENDPLMKQATAEGVSHFHLSSESAKICLQQPQDANEVVRTEVIQWKPINEVVQQGCQFAESAFASDSFERHPYLNTPIHTEPAPHQPPVGTLRNTGTKVGRNEPCPCGSNKKYKKCCMKR